MIAKSHEVSTRRLLLGPGALEQVKVSFSTGWRCMRLRVEVAAYRC
jgi:hypothetical protein